MVHGLNVLQVATSPLFIFGNHFRRFSLITIGKTFATRFADSQLISHIGDFILGMHAVFIKKSDLLIVIRSLFIFTILGRVGNCLVFVRSIYLGVILIIPINWYLSFASIPSSKFDTFYRYLFYKTGARPDLLQCLLYANHLKIDQKCAFLIVRGID